MGFWKWVFRALLLLGSIAVATILGNGFVVSSLPMIIGYNIAGSLILGYSFYLVETKYLPRQRKKITNRLIALFDAKIVDESVIEFYLGALLFMQN
jgi:hypothetical protein